MMDDLEKSAVTEIPWSEKERRILAEVRGRGLKYMWAGYLVYGGGTAAIIAALGDRPVTGYLVMFLFQLAVIYFGTREMYVNMAAMFRLSLEANRETMPTFTEISNLAKDVRKAVETGEHPVVRQADKRLEEIAGHMAAIRAAIEKTTAPVPVNRRGANGSEKVGVPSC